MRQLKNRLNRKVVDQDNGKKSIIPSTLIQKTFEGTTLTESVCYFEVRISLNCNGNIIQSPKIVQNCSFKNSLYPMPNMGSPLPKKNTFSDPLKQSRNGPGSRRSTSFVTIFDYLALKDVPAP